MADPLPSAGSSECVRSIVGASQVATAVEQLVTSVLPRNDRGQLRMPSYTDLVQIACALTRPEGRTRDP